MGHCHAFGHQVGNQDEAARDQRECQQRRGRTAPTARVCQQTAEIRAHRRFADDTGENGDGVQTDLDDGDETARLLLHVEHVERARVAAVFSHDLQFDFARRGEREFGTGNKCADDDQQAQ